MLVWCQLMPEVWICHDSILLQHACTLLDILINIPDSKLAAIFIPRVWDYHGAKGLCGLQPLEVKSDSWVNHPVQASDL